MELGIGVDSGVEGGDAVGSLGVGGVLGAGRGVGLRDEVEVEVEVGLRGEVVGMSIGAEGAVDGGSCSRVLPRFRMLRVGWVCGSRLGTRVR